jgi:hypothetical protein
MEGQFGPNLISIDSVVSWELGIHLHLLMASVADWTRRRPDVWPRLVLAAQRIGSRGLQTSLRSMPQELAWHSESRELCAQITLLHLEP